MKIIFLNVDINVVNLKITRLVTKIDKQCPSTEGVLQ
jgi:hypothetical protein